MEDGATLAALLAPFARADPPDPRAVDRGGVEAWTAEVGEGGSSSGDGHAESLDRAGHRRGRVEGGRIYRHVSGS